MSAAIVFAVKFGVAIYLLITLISFITGYRWRERKKELERRGHQNVD